MQIERNATVTEIHCPIPECKKEWEWELCLIVANMDQSEKQKLCTLRANRENAKHGNNFKQCPGCKCMVSKPDSITQAWFVC